MFRDCSATSLPAAVKASLDAAIKTATTDPYTQLPQIVLLATSSTSALYSGSSGYAPPPGSSSSSPLSSLEKISPDSVFDLFSATKLVTCIAALQLVEQGLLDLNDDASQWVPELNGKEIFTGWSEEEKPTYKSTGAVVSVEMLLTHTAGFAYDFIDENLSKLRETLELVRPYDEDAVRESVTGLPFVNEPGSRWAYGTSNDYLSLLVEAVSSTTLAEYFQRHIFTPLGIMDMTYDRLSGSPASYLRLLRALLNGGLCPDGTTRILRSEIVDSMFVGKMKTESLREDVRKGTWQTSDPWARKRGSAFPGADWGFGGVLTGDGYPKGRKSGTLSWSGNAKPYWIIDRESDLAYVFFTQIVPHGIQPVFDVWEDLETLLYAGLQ